MPIREARDDELPAVMNVLDGGLLATRAEHVREAAAAGNVLVAVEADRVLGALVLDPLESTPGARVDALAVRRRRRGQGVGTALVLAAAEHHGELTVAFDERVRPFWTGLGAAVEPGGEAGRFVGTIRQDRDE